MQDKNINNLNATITERINGAYNDLRAFIFIRIHYYHKNEPYVGGGNMTMALTLFSALNYLSKIYYCIMSPEKFNIDVNGKITVNETHAFKKFARHLISQDILSGITMDDSALSLVWNGFRDHLAHKITVQNGKVVYTFEFEVSDMKNTNMDQVMLSLKKGNVFIANNEGRDWHVNVDVLLSILPEITESLLGVLNTSNIKNYELLKRVVL